MTTNPVYDSGDREYARARVRLRDLTGDSSPVQKLMDDAGDGLVLVTDHNDDGEQIVYSTRNPELIHEFCDRLVQRLEKRA
jgi:hypothetical protein